MVDSYRVVAVENERVGGFKRYVRCRIDRQEGLWQDMGEDEKRV